jgi:hypothetical protein
VSFIASLKKATIQIKLVFKITYEFNKKFNSIYFLFFRTKSHERSRKLIYDARFKNDIKKNTQNRIFSPLEGLISQVTA